MQDPRHAIVVRKWCLLEALDAGENCNAAQEIFDED
jgi:hypothetical protein